MQEYLKLAAVRTERALCNGPCPGIIEMPQARAVKPLCRRLPRPRTQVPDDAQDLVRRLGNVGARTVDRGDTGLSQEVVILGRNDAAADHDDVLGPCLLQFLVQ